MSFVISVYTHEGIVMAADSRLTLTYPRVPRPGEPDGVVSTPSSDSATKLFLLGNGVGVSTFGIATVAGSPIAGAIETFSVEGDLASKSLSPEETAVELSKYFLKIAPGQQTCFHVGGYQRTKSTIELQLWVVDLAAGTTIRVNKSNIQGANWGGETDVLQRLISEVHVVQSPGAQPQPVPSFLIPFEFFTLQDAIDFALFGARTTSDTMRFQKREKTVGGPIDVLVLTPAEARWVSKKQLRTER